MTNRINLSLGILVRDGFPRLQEQFDTKVDPEAYVLDADHERMAETVASFLTGKIAKSGAIPSSIKAYEAALKRGILSGMQGKLDEIDVMVRDEDPGLTGSASPAIRCTNITYAPEDIMYMHCGVKCDPWALVNDAYDVKEAALIDGLMAIHIQPYTKKILIQQEGRYFEMDWRNRQVPALQLNF